MSKLLCTPLLPLLFQVMKRSALYRAAFLLALCLSAVSVYAQSTASLTGSVNDPSGAVVVDAAVIITNSETGVQTPTKTNSAGSFAVSNLLVGKYSVKVERQGFRTETEDGVLLLTGQTVNLKLNLQVGSEEQSVEVTSDTQIVQTTTSDVQFTIDKTQMENLPLNGRNAFDLATLAPGATTTAASTTPGQQDNNGLSVNGFAATSNTWLLDGGTYNNLHFGSAPTLPNPDALQEFTIQTGTFSAENRAGGAVIKLTTRSGGNAFHGNVYEFVRNTIFDAVNYFQTTQNPYKLNQFGGTIGGPIKKDILFFFGSYQGTIQRGSPGPEPVNVPTSAERNGVFPNVIINPATGSPYANNTVPKPFDAIATKLLALYPVAANGGSIFYEPTASNRNDQQYLGRADYHLGKKDLITARYFYDDNLLDHDEGTVPGFKANNEFTNQTFLISDVHTFSPSWILHGFFNYLRTFRNEVPVSNITLQSLGANIPPAQPGIPDKISVALNGYTRIFSGRGLTFNPQVMEYAADVSHAGGNHFIRFGGGLRHNTEYAFNLGDELGTFTFTAARTSSTAYKSSGDALASMLLGLPATFVQSSSAPENFLLDTFDLWAQDDWKVTPKLTLNLGMRYEPWLPAHDTFGLLSGFTPGVQSTLGPLVPRGLLFSGDPGIPASITRNHWNSFSPRVGFALDVFGSGHTVLRGGFGIFRQGTEFFGQQRTFANNTPTRSANVTIINPPSIANPYQGYTGGSPFPYQPISPSQLATFKLGANYALTAFDPDTKPEYSESYSLAVEQRVSPSSSVTFTYVGSHMLHGILAYNANPAVYSPTATVANTSSRVLYPGFANITYGTSANHSSYNALQVQYTYRASHGLTATANYVYSKILDIDTAGGQGIAANVGPSDPFNLMKDYGLADYDLTHQFKAAIIYQVPKSNAGSTFVRAIENGWRFNAITVLQSGLPFTCRSGVDNSLSNTNLDHCDQVGSAARPAGASPILHWFNQAAFTTNAIGTFGNTGRNQLRRPAYLNLNVAVFRDFPIHKSVTGEFRVESFNTLNHPNLDLFNEVTGYTNGVAVSSSTFGQLVTASDPRLVQLALKIMF